jgi:hypothetical protein
MPEETRDRERRGFMFTDEDFARRYCGEEEAADAIDPTAPQSNPTRARIRGGGNTFMRARRRRLAIAGLRRF